MTFSPDKSPKGNISTERERGERNSFHDRSSTTSSQKRKFKKATNIESTLSPIDDVSPMFRTKKRPATILLFVPSEIRGEFFEASAFSCVSKSCGTGKTGGRNISRRWKKTAKRYISFGNCGVSEARLPRRHLLRSLTSNETKGGDSCLPGATFRDNETYLTDTRAFFNAPTSTN